MQAPFIEIENTLNQIKEEYPRLEPENFALLVAGAAQQPLVAAVKSSWLPLLNIFRTVNWTQIKQDFVMFGSSMPILQGAQL